MKKKNKIIAFCAVLVILAAAVSTAVLAIRDTEPQRAVEVDSLLTSERAYNILLIGTDREAGLADVMMLARLDLAAKRAFIMQIPRDTYAEYTDGSYKKLNGAYSALGAAGLCDFLSDALGMSVDRYVVTGLDTVRDIIDAVGGVDVNIPCDMKYRDKTQELYIDLKAGLQHLDGDAAEQFLRFRSGYIEGDIDRMDAQKIFLAATAKKIKDEFSLGLAYRLLEAADGIETNFSASELLNIALEASGIGSESITVLTMPGAEARAASGASYYSISSKAVASIVETYFGAAHGGFDTDGVFLNEKNAAFRNVYNGYTEYKAYTLADIAQNGIEIDLK